MSTAKQILVVLDPHQQEQKALSRALYLARQLSAEVTVFLSIYDFAYEMTTMLAADERESMRSSLIADRKAWIIDIIDDMQANTKYSGVNIDIEVMWHNRPFEAIIKTAIQKPFDLIVKGTRQHEGFQNLIFTPTDWHLLRKAPCQVLMVKDHAWQQQGKIIAAVHAGATDDDHVSLNERIITSACELAAQVNAQVHLVNSFPPAPMTVAMEIPEFDVTDYSDSVKTNHEQALAELAAKHQIPGEQTHVVEGLPEQVVPELARKLDAELVVLGTIGRSGLSAALLGNTAEHVLDQLQCDVLAVKPAGFKSPVQV
ncbi:universal stress protein E [Pseudidiomarina planktonica]|uniref:Universal stress protein E n=1 Tax=Pseudidiomarina planktonica TaxID=1323738 RepID=A0A1Y6ESR1_9GAMM|nr:universal stress protein UspE [Pseudidiomarina planktonica]RUO65303.1 universal stress protein UspE [Pseudidiomarina planktonica]SMQ65587.1 universal stress protein E [Pseudidiomarina planktonica]